MSTSEDQLQDRLNSGSAVEPPTSIPDADPDLVIGRLPRHSSPSQPLPPDEESLTSYYKRIGYLPPLSESTLEVIRQVLADPTMGRGAGRVVSEAEQQAGLVDRNVNWRPRSDPYHKTIASLQTQIIPENDVDGNRKWDDDLDKCRFDPQEFVFQRTVMMSMINRHRFIYGKDGVLDFAVERPWTCSPMPTRALEEPDGKSLPMSQPDIAIAFRTTALMDAGKYEYLPRQLRNVVCYEGIAEAHQFRAFHFFMIEAKNTYKSILDPVSQYQVLNSASQSLHNMYEFFNEAGPEHLAKFFDKVRVFTAVSTTEGIIIRIHRACLVGDFRDESPSQQNLPAPKFPILPDYPLQFEYDIYLKAIADAFSREQVLSALETIMIKYGAEILLMTLKDAADDVIKRFRARREDRPKHYYSHHQKSHVPPKKKGKTPLNAKTIPNRAPPPLHRPRRHSQPHKSPFWTPTRGICTERTSKRCRH